LIRSPPSWISTERAFGLELRFFDEALGLAELETGGSTLAIAAHSLGEMVMPNGYMRPADGQPAGVEIAFLTRDVSGSFAKAMAEEASPITEPRRMPWGLEVAYVRHAKVQTTNRAWMTARSESHVDV